MTVDDLREGLIGPHHRLWHTSAEFRGTIELLAQLLPVWIDGLAAVATKNDAERMKQFTAALKYAPRAVQRFEVDHTGVLDLGIGPS